MELATATKLCDGNEGAILRLPSSRRLDDERLLYKDCAVATYLIVHFDEVKLKDVDT